MNNHSLGSVQLFFSILWIAWINAIPGLAQDRFEKLKVGDQIEVLFLNEWRPAVIVELDQKENARVEYEFAGGKQVDNFLRAAIRRPYEKGAILATRTYTDKSGKHKIIAALIAMTDSEVRLRRSDGSEKDVPLSSLSDSDQKYLKGLVRKGLKKLDQLPAKRDRDAHTWTLVSGDTIDGVFVEQDGLDIVVRSADGTARHIPMQQLSPQDLRHAITMQNEMLSKANSIRGMDASASGESTPLPGAGESESIPERGREGFKRLEQMELQREKRRNMEKNATPPSPSLKAKILEQDQWGFSPDTVASLRRVSQVDLTLQAEAIRLSLDMLATRTGDKLLCVMGSDNEKDVLIDLRDGKVTDVAKQSKGETLAISPSAKRIAVTGRSRERIDEAASGAPARRSSPSFGVFPGWKMSDELEILDTQSGQIVGEGWIPYGLGKNVHHFAFIDDDYGLTVSEIGDLGVWDLQAKKVLWWFKMRALSTPAISAGGKLLFVQSADHLIVFESLTGKVVSQTPSSQHGIRLMVVDDACERLAGLGNGKVRVWDLRSGKITHEFGISPSVHRPQCASWLSPTQIVVDTEITFDVVDIQIQGTAYALNKNIENNYRLFNGSLFIPVGQSNQLHIINPALQTPEFTRRSNQFESTLAYDLKPGSRVMLQVNVAPSMNKSVETERVTQLLTNAGYQVVAQGGKATFVANLREEKQGDDKPLEQMSEADFRPTKDLILMSGNKAIWRATIDVLAEKTDNKWAGYVVPPTLRVSQSAPPLFFMNEPNVWKEEKLSRDYTNGFSQRVQSR